MEHVEGMEEGRHTRAGADWRRTIVWRHWSVAAEIRP